MNNNIVYMEVISWRKLSVHNINYIIHKNDDRCQTMVFVLLRFSDNVIFITINMTTNYVFIVKYTAYTQSPWETSRDRRLTLMF